MGLIRFSSDSLLTATQPAQEMQLICVHVCFMNTLYRLFYWM